ncbi:unnamed protein product [Moneuplotes crassus]|uniref:USP domain-containing protein n=1 Tax=Euplotes crassus TaxID=5936 RepID=A0AAD1XD76_EUPCR|nr:unnamed protein product [Moneuplotes crassus]
MGSCCPIGKAKNDHHDDLRDRDRSGSDSKHQGNEEISLEGNIEGGRNCNRGYGNRSKKYKHLSKNQADNNGTPTNPQKDEIIVKNSKRDPGSSKNSPKNASPDSKISPSNQQVSNSPQKVPTPSLEPNVLDQEGPPSKPPADNSTPAPDASVQADPRYSEVKSSKSDGAILGQEGSQSFSEESSFGNASGLENSPYGSLISAKGVINPSNDCFFIVVLQCLFAIEELKKDIYFKNKGEITNGLKKVLSQFKDENPVDASEVRLLFNQEFESHQQHDANQIMMEMFQKIKAEIKPSSLRIPKNKDFEEWNEFQKCNSTVIDRLFAGMTCKVFACKKCDHEIKVFEEFYNIPLECSEENPSIGYERLKECLDEIDESDFLCEKCKEIQVCSIKTEIIQYPRYLILVLQRLCPFTQQKINGKIKYDKDLKLGGSNKKQAIKYTLNNVINHYGSIKFGHYTCLCKGRTGWKEFNDEQVTLLKESMIETQEDAYILIYKKQK